MISLRRATCSSVLSTAIITNLLVPSASYSCTRRASDLHPLLQTRRAMLNLDVKTEVRGIIFDMDGTLTEPGAINFSAMYERNGLVKTPGEDILSLISKLPQHQQDAVLKVILEEELIGCDHMKIRPNMHKFLRAANTASIPVALSTRNCDAAYQRFLQLADLPADYFSPALHRDSLNGLNKPDPLVAKHILDAWKIQAGQESGVWFIGDSTDDMACGKLAGCSTCLITTGDNNHVVLKSPELVDVVVDSFDELLAYFKLRSE